MGSQAVLIIGGGLTLLGLAMIPSAGPGVLVVAPGFFVLLTGVVMSAASSPSELPTGARRWWPYVGVAGIFAVLPAVALLIDYLTAPDYNASGQCEGIGFGCVPTPKDTIHFLALFGYPVLVVVGLLFMATLAGAGAWRRPPR